MARAVVVDTSAIRTGSGGWWLGGDTEGGVEVEGADVVDDWRDADVETRRGRIDRHNCTDGLMSYLENERVMIGREHNVRR